MHAGRGAMDKPVRAAAAAPGGRNGGKWLRHFVFAPAAGGGANRRPACSSIDDMCPSPDHVVLIAGALSSLTLLSPTTMPYDRGGTVHTSSVCDAASPSLPPTIVLERGLEPIVRATLESSPTFRQQCRILEAAPSVTATVRITSRTPGAAERALSRVRRSPEGAIAAAIEIRHTPDIAELLGHEFEHVIEQLDGVNLRTLEAAGEARRLVDGAFETRRAIAAGQRVSSEALDRSPDRLRRALGRIVRVLAPGR